MTVLTVAQILHTDNTKSIDS